ncbi:MAG TPA: FkbM family methyltransferase [Vicinamibacterales bacterium]|nr:FkbM family methyltransferase [Vicinamibacterales bacterium]
MKQKTIVGGLVIVVVLAAIVLAPDGVNSVGWRAGLISRIITGDLPGVSLGEFLREVRPSGGRLLVRRKTGELHRDINFLMKRNDGSPCAYLWQTPLGAFWGRADDRPILGHLVHQQLKVKIYNSHEVAVNAGDVVLDVGSHLGIFTKVALDAGASKVVAIEPEPLNNRCFKQTFEQAIKDGRVILVEAAAWHSKEKLQFKVEAESDASALDEKGELTVQALPIDDIVDELKLDRVDFLKFDIEGAERHALDGARKTLARFGPDMVVSVYHLPDDPQVIQKIVAAANPAYNLRESTRRDHGFYMNYFTIHPQRGPQ